MHLLHAILGLLVHRVESVVVHRFLLGHVAVGHHPRLRQALVRRESLERIRQHCGMLKVEIDEGRLAL